MKTDAAQKLTFLYGSFAASTMLNGIVQPDMQISNIGFTERGMVFTDFAEATKILIPDDLSKETMRRLSRSILPLFDCFPNYESKSSLPRCQGTAEN